MYSWKLIEVRTYCLNDLITSFLMICVTVVLAEIMMMVVSVYHFPMDPDSSHCLYLWSADTMPHRLTPSPNNNSCWDPRLWLRWPIINRRTAVAFLLCAVAQLKLFIALSLYLENVTCDCGDGGGHWHYYHCHPDTQEPVTPTSFVQTQTAVVTH